VTPSEGESPEPAKPAAPKPAPSIEVPVPDRETLEIASKAVTGVVLIALLRKWVG